MTPGQHRSSPGACLSPRHPAHVQGFVPIQQAPSMFLCSSFSIAAGVNAKALCTYLGHSSVEITFDRYGHLMPGSENEAAGLLDIYLAASA